MLPKDNLAHYPSLCETGITQCSHNNGVLCSPATERADCIAMLVKTNQFNMNQMGKVTSLAKMDCSTQCVSHTL